MCLEDRPTHGSGYEKTSSVQSTACDEMCGKKKSKRDQGDLWWWWWWNEEVEDTIARKKAAFKEVCRLSLEENKTKYKSSRSQTRKIVARAMRKKPTKN